MGKAGRFACIFLPMALTLASLICLVLVGLGGTNKSSTALSDLYFFKADTASVSINKTIDLIPGTTIDNQALDKYLQRAKSTLNLKDFYTVHLWNYCSGNRGNNSTAGRKIVEFCSPRQSQFWFNPVEVWGLNNTDAEQIFPKQLEDGLDAYRTASKWMFIGYIVAFATTVLTLVVGILAIFSRWGSFVTTVVSVLATIFTIAASLTATLLYSTLATSFNTYLNPYNIHGSVGRSMFATTWLAVAFSLAASVFWLFSVCCCSGRSGNDRVGRSSKRVKVEDTPYTYERVASPYLGQNANGNERAQKGKSGGGVPLGGMGQGQGSKAHSYEPYRHENV